MVKEETFQVHIDADSKKAEALYRNMRDFCRDSLDFHNNTYGRLSRYADSGLMVQIASLNGHLCHIWRPACDLNGGQPRTH